MQVGPKRSLNLVEKRTTRTNEAVSSLRSCLRLLIVMGLLFGEHLWPGCGLIVRVSAVSVQRLIVPDLVVIDQQNQPYRQLQHQLARSSSAPPHRSQSTNLGQQQNNQPEAASLINSQEFSSNDQQITFECQVAYDKRKDKNLIVKWHHDDRTEPIYQWIPELNKRSIALKYRPFIAPIVPNNDGSTSISGSNSQNSSQLDANPDQIQMLEVGFKLIRPTQELGGKYTCSAISTENDDSKSKKMIVFSPPKNFRFNASRIDAKTRMATQHEQFILMSQQQPVPSVNQLSTSSSGQHQLPLVYRMRGFESGSTTVSPDTLHSTIDHVNVNQLNRQPASPSSWIVGPPTSAPNVATSAASHLSQTRQKYGFINSQSPKQSKQLQNGIKLVCDIDQVFPVPEVSIYRLAKLDGSHPNKLSKLDTRIERNTLNGLYHVQVTSILDEDELQMKYGSDEPVYFECLIALTNLELSKYADNKRSIVYRPNHLTSGTQGLQADEDLNSLDGMVGSLAGGSRFRISKNLLAFATFFTFLWLRIKPGRCSLLLQ